MTDPLRTLERRLAPAELANLRTAVSELAGRVDELEAALARAEDRAIDAESAADAWRDIADQDALSIERMRRIADFAAEELIRGEGTTTSAPDEYLINSNDTETHMMDCIDHLCARGLAAQQVTDGGDVIVQIIQEPTL